MRTIRLAQGSPAGKLALLILMLLLGSCAKARPRLTPAQRAFVEVPIAESGTLENEDDMDITIPAFDPLTAADPSEVIDARFRGTDRKVPKITIAGAARKDFD